VRLFAGGTAVGGTTALPDRRFDEDEGLKIKWGYEKKKIEKSSPCGRGEAPVSVLEKI
jgi:hypothetical protein